MAIFLFSHLFYRFTIFENFRESNKMKNNKTDHFLVFTLLIIFSFILQSEAAYTKECHYSCTFCGDQLYSHCIMCRDQFTLTPLKNKNHNDKYYNTIQQYPWGTCIGAIPNLNVLGIVLLVLSAILLVIFKNRTFFYFFNTFQTFGLLSLIETGYVPHISYVLQSFQYFMLTSSLNKLAQQELDQIKQSTRYRLFSYLNSYQFKQNFVPLFVFSLLAFALAFLIPVCRYFSKKDGSVWSICNCLNLPKLFTLLQVGSIMIFFFLMQESVLNISVGLFNDQRFLDGGNIILVIIYSILLALMIVNICSKNFDFFPNKASQQIQILKKTILPPFIILRGLVNVAVAPFMCLMAFLGIIFNSTNKFQKKKTLFHQNLIAREFKYRIVEILAIISVILYFIVEKFANSANASNAIGIVSLVIVGIFVSCFFLQVGIQLYGKFKLDQDQKLYAETLDFSSSLRPNKILQETLQNLENTQEGIMDMVFFARDFSGQKQSPKKSKNIKLNLDILQGSENITQHKQNVTTTTSPINRDNERFKSRTARTPKNDNTTNRFKLNKAFEDATQKHNNQLQSVQINSINLQRSPIQNKHEKSPQYNQNSQFKFKINIEPNKSQRSQDLHPKTSRREDAIKTVRQIRVDVMSVSDYDVKKSPRFGIKDDQEIEQIKDKKQEKQEKQRQNKQQNVELDEQQNKEEEIQQSDEISQPNQQSSQNIQNHFIPSNNQLLPSKKKKKGKKSTIQKAYGR